MSLLCIFHEVNTNYKKHSSDVIPCHEDNGIPFKYLTWPSDFLKPFQESIYSTFKNRMNCSLFPQETQYCSFYQFWVKTTDTICANKMLIIRMWEKSSLKIKVNIPAMFPQGCEWGASQLMQENMVPALYASALTHTRILVHLWHILSVITIFHDQPPYGTNIS